MHVCVSVDASGVVHEIPLHVPTNRPCWHAYVHGHRLLRPIGTCPGSVRSPCEARACTAQAELGGAAAVAAIGTWQAGTGLRLESDVRGFWLLQTSPVEAAVLSSAVLSTAVDAAAAHRPGHPA